MAVSFPFSAVVSDQESLRTVLGYPGDRSVAKELARIDRHARYFIERAPFVLLSSAGVNGRCDVSPKGDQPGFVKVLDDRTILIPDRPGNRRGDTLNNILENPHLGLLFLIPDVEETLRLNGRAQIIRDPDHLATLEFAGKVPELAIAVEAEEVYFHCAKAFKRSGLWQPDQWAGRGDLPSLGQIMKDQIAYDDRPGETINCEIEESYRTNLY